MWYVSPQVENAANGKCSAPSTDDRDSRGSHWIANIVGKFNDWSFPQTNTSWRVQSIANLKESVSLANESSEDCSLCYGQCDVLSGTLRTTTTRRPFWISSWACSSQLQLFSLRLFTLGSSFPRPRRAVKLSCGYIFWHDAKQPEPLPIVRSHHYRMIIAQSLHVTPNLQRRDQC